VAEEAGYLYGRTGSEIEQGYVKAEKCAKEGWEQTGTAVKQGWEDTKTEAEKFKEAASAGMRRGEKKAEENTKA